MPTSQWGLLWLLYIKWKFSPRISYPPYYHAELALSDIPYLLLYFFVDPCLHQPNVSSLTAQTFVLFTALSSAPRMLLVHSCHSGIWNEPSNTMFYMYIYIFTPSLSNLRFSASELSLNEIGSFLSFRTF